MIQHVSAAKFSTPTQFWGKAKSKYSLTKRNKQRKSRKKAKKLKKRLLFLKETELLCTKNGQKLILQWFLKIEFSLTTTASGAIEHAWLIHLHNKYFVGLWRHNFWSRDHTDAILDCRAGGKLRPFSCESEIEWKAEHWISLHSGKFTGRSLVNRGGGFPVKMAKKFRWTCVKWEHGAADKMHNWQHVMDLPERRWVWEICANSWWYFSLLIRVCVLFVSHQSFGSCPDPVLCVYLRSGAFKFSCAREFVCRWFGKLRTI